MHESKNQNYLHGAAILAVAVVAVKILGAVYKIPMGNILDTVGYAHFNVAYNIYSVFLALSTAGLPIALSRMISEANNLNRPNQVKKIYSVGMKAFIVLGLAGTAIMLMFSTELAVFMGDVQASQSIFAMAPSVLLVCIMSAYRGYNQGLSDMVPTSVSQVVEVAVKVVFGMAVLLIMDKAGYSSSMLSAGAISGVAVGSLVACVYMGVVSGKRSKLETGRVYEDPSASKDSDSNGALLKKLIKIGLPIALGACVIAVITLINTKLIFDRLQTPLALGGAGFDSDTAQNLFGLYSLAIPLYNLPAAFITPLTVSVVPAIAGYFALKKHYDAKIVTESSMRIATIISLPMAVGLAVLSGPIMHAFYNKTSTDASWLLAILGMASFFVCMALMTTAILQASGREKTSMTTLLIGGGINIAVNWFLLGNPNINIFGAPLGTLVCYIIMSGLNLFFVLTKLPEKPSVMRIFLLPIINSALMGVIAWLMYPAALRIIGAGLDPTRMQALIALVVAVGVGAIVYLVLTIFTKTITMDDMKLIPKGEKLAKLLHIK